MRFEDLLRDTAAAARKEALAEGMAIGMAQGRAEGRAEGIAQGRAAVKEKDILRAFAVLEESGKDSETIFSMLSEIFAESPDQIKRIIAGHSD